MAVPLGFAVSNVLLVNLLELERRGLAISSSLCVEVVLISFAPSLRTFVIGLSA